MTATHAQVKSTFQLMERVEGVQYRFFTIHGYRRAFLSAGQGPPLLLIHGIGDSSSTWLPVVESFATDYTVIAPDLLGHGLSDKPRADYSVAAYANGMRDLLSVLDVDRVTVIGHSLGGGVAAQFAYTFPERCERLVLVGTGGIARSVSVLLRLAAAPNVDLLMPTYGSPVFKLGSRIAAHVLRLMETDLGHDTIFPVDQGHLSAASMPGSRLEVFEGAGHFPHHSVPERFTAVVRAFLD